MVQNVVELFFGRQAVKVQGHVRYVGGSVWLKLLAHGQATAHGARHLLAAGLCQGHMPPDDGILIAAAAWHEKCGGTWVVPLHRRLESNNT